MRPGEGLTIFDIRDHRELYPASGLEAIFVGSHRVTPASGYHVENTRREEAWIFQYTVAGAGVLDQAGESPATVGPGTGFLIHIPEASSYSLAPNAEEWKVLFVKFRGPVADRICAAICERGGAVLELGVHSPAVGGVRELLTAAGLERPLSPFHTAARLYAVLSQLYASTAPLLAVDESRVQEAMAIIRSRYPDPGVTVQAVAEAVNLSRSHFTRLFRAHAGMSPQGFLLEVRFARARELLANTGVTVSEIAQLSGFSGAAHFSALFRRHVGLSPREFRARGRA
jgi:AraC-like DNA-binding protein